MDFINIVHELKERNKYLELKLDEVCNKVKIMSRPKLYITSNADDIPPSNKVKAMAKEDIVELLEKDKRKCNVVISNLEEDGDNACNVNDESRVMSLVHDVLQPGDIGIVSAVRVTGIQQAIQRRTSRRFIVHLGSLNQQYNLPRQTRKLKVSEGYRIILLFQT